jgi:homoaconitate hydratase
MRAKLDLVKGKIEIDGIVFNVPKVGKAAQELVVEGGLENWVKSRIL